jgi:superfamily II DNA/RNA helicase
MRFVLYGVLLAALASSYHRPRTTRWRSSPAATVVVRGTTRSDADVVTFAGVKFGVPLSTSMRTLGITEPTPIQKTSIAPLTAGLSCILHAQTGSGKTLTYLLPLLKRLLGSDGTVDMTPLQGLIIVPTKELAVQVAADVAALLSKSDDVIDCSAVHLCLKTTRAGFDDVKAPIVVGTPFKVLSSPSP